LTVLLTGATGFIGSRIAHTLIERGHPVRVAVRSSSTRERLAAIEDRLAFRTLDVFSAPPDELAQLADGVNCCIHAAWFAVPGQYLTSPENLRCVEGSLALLDALARAGCRRAVFVGSCFEYDFDPGYLSERSPERPQSLYAASKLATRHLAEHIAHAHQISFAWARPFYQYGPFEDRRRLVPYVIETLSRGEPVQVTKGLQVRDFLHVRDVGSAIASIALADVEGVVNVGSGQPVTVRQIVSTIETLLDRAGLVQYGARPDNPTDPPFVCANNRKLVEATGWSPSFDLRSGLEDTIAWSREHASSK
jgi:nucleoside-diphosphate-sugar epimerase